jgi:hypothetical protein
MIETQYSQVHPVLHVDLVYIILYTCTNVNTHKHIVPLAIAFTILQTAIFGENSGICKTGTQQPFEPWTSAAEFQNTVPYSVLQVDNSLRRPPAAWRAGAGWPGRPATPTPRPAAGRPPSSSEGPPGAIMADQRSPRQSVSLQARTLLPPAEGAHIRAQFDAADLDGSGELDQDEVRGVVLACTGRQLTELELRDAMAEMDLGALVGCYCCRYRCLGGGQPAITST